MQTDARLCRICSEVTPQAAVPPGRAVELAPGYEWRTTVDPRRVVQVWLCLSCLTCNLEVYPRAAHPQNLRAVARGKEESPR